MIKFKALAIGVISMLFLGLIFELIFLFVEIGYNLLIKDFPGLKSFKQVFNYLFILVGLFFVMFSGGYLTSVYAKSHTLYYTVAATIITCSIALYATGSSYTLTLFSGLFILVSIVFSFYGNYIFKRNSIENL